MPRPREYDSAAERQAAYRARQRQEEYEARLRLDQQRQERDVAIQEFQAAVRHAALTGDADAKELATAGDLTAQLQLLAEWYGNVADDLAARKK